MAHLYLQLHLFSQVAHRRQNELLLGVTGSVAFLVLQEHYAAAYITGGDDRGLHQRIIGNALNGLQRLPIARRKAPAVLNLIFQAMGYPTLQHLPPADAADRHYMVPVGNETGKPLDQAIFSCPQFLYDRKIYAKGMKVSERIDCP